MSCFQAVYCKVFALNSILIHLRVSKVVHLFQFGYTLTWEKFPIMWYCIQFWISFTVRLIGVIYVAIKLIPAIRCIKVIFLHVIDRIQSGTLASKGTYLWLSYRFLFQVGPDRAPWFFWFHRCFSVVLLLRDQPLLHGQDWSLGLLLLPCRLHLPKSQPTFIDQITKDYQGCHGHPKFVQAWHSIKMGQNKLFVFISYLTDIEICWDFTVLTFLFVMTM